VSEIKLQMFHEDNKEGELIARITKRESPSRQRLSNPEELASREARRAAEASTKRTLVNNFIVAVRIIEPKESLITIATTKKEPRTATSKLAL
jgi:hypothetical protein